jgi:hypothetical protein
MNRRSFLWQGLYSSLPFFAKATFSLQVAGSPISKPSAANLTAFEWELTGRIFRPNDPKYEKLRQGYDSVVQELDQYGPYPH